MEILEKLDPEQRAAATAGRGRVRVRAGAGTGKTTTLTARIVHLLGERAVDPRELLVVTFTNKAAQEIRDRVTEALESSGVDDGAARRIPIATFHSHSARLLRRHAELARLRDGNFTIADESDTKKLVVEALMDVQALERIDEVTPPGESQKEIDEFRKEYFRENSKRFQDLAGEAHTQIMRWKENGLTIEDVQCSARPRRSTFEEVLAEAYHHYQDALEDRNMADFADLISKVVRLLAENEQIRQRESRRVRHLLIDEFQDVNPEQARWAELLSSVHGNLFVVGDIDQSIYGFRGSTPQVMEQMAGGLTHDFVLRRNRRCTEQILGPANLLVNSNPRDDEKELSSGRDGAPVKLLKGENEYAEAAIIAKQIRGLLDEGVEPSEIACLVRTSRVALALERAFLMKSIPFIKLGGVALTEREEVKDALAYLRLALNDRDDLAFMRIANRPVRGLGPVAVEHIRAIARAERVSMADACFLAAGSRGVRLRADARENLGRLGSLLVLLRETAEENDVASVLHEALYSSQYRDWVAGRGGENVSERLRNLKVMMTLSRSFKRLEDFVDALSLASEDEVEELENRVRISTMHSAKGLEFDYVFCPAFEEGIMPHRRALSDAERRGPGDLDDPWNPLSSGGLEEERRLAHVAFTRARHRLYVSYAKNRGNRRAQPSSLLETAELIAPRLDSDQEYEEAPRRPAPRGRNRPALRGLAGLAQMRR